MRVKVNFVFQEDQVDPIYKKFGLEMDADAFEIVEEGWLDLDHVIAASEFYELTQVYCTGGHTFLIDLPLNEFEALWT
jgi:hypothetical protein